MGSDQGGETAAICFSILAGAKRHRIEPLAYVSALLTALSQELDGRATWLQPAGGNFVWVTLPPGRDASALLPQAEANGTSYLPGSTFYLEAGEGVRSLRLAFSRCGHEELVEAVRRLGLTLSGATVRSGPSAI